MRTQEVGERAFAHEVHRWYGFVRFRVGADGVLRSRIAPDHEVLEALAPHFAGRLQGQCWMIVDTTHEKTAVFNGQYYEIRAARPSELSRGQGPLAPDDNRGGFGTCPRNSIEDLWQEYFKTIAIPERRNPALQRRCLPNKYRRDLIELA